MKRVGMIAAALVMCVGGCDKKASNGSATGPADKPPTPVGPAKPVVVDAAAAAKPHPNPLPAELDVEPKAAPPAAIVKKTSRGDCQTAYAPKPTRDPNPMCKVKGGTFTFGPVFPDDPEKTAKTTRKVTLTDFYIDQLEVTNAQYAFFLNTIGKRDMCPSVKDTGNCLRLESDSSHRYWRIEQEPNGAFKSPDGRAAHPVRSVTYEGALRYCQWAGKDLPTSPQWEYAAVYDPDKGVKHRYPWGDADPTKRVNCKDCDDAFEHTAPVGTFNGEGDTLDGSSPFGALDMLGNATEWLAGCVPYQSGLGPEIRDEFCQTSCRDPGYEEHEHCKFSRQVAGYHYRSPHEVLKLTDRWESDRGDSSGNGLRCAIGAR